MRVNRLLKLAAGAALLLPFSASAMFANPYSNSNPVMDWCGSYYSYGTCINYAPHTFSPYTYINTSPYVNVSASASSYAYPYVSYPNQQQQQQQQQMYGYSYPQYQTSNYQPTSYYQPSSNYYQPTSYYQPSYYQDYSYRYPSYASSYSSQDGYCYTGYGCYPLPVDDPHQWIYDSWTGTWY